MLKADVVVDSEKVERWKIHALQRLVDENEVEINCLLISKNKSGIPWPFRLYDLLEQTVHPIPDRAVSRIPLEESFPEVPVRDLAGHVPSQAALLINLTDLITPVSLKNSYPKGMIYYRFASSPVGFREQLNQEAAVWSSLWLDKDGDSALLYQSWSPLDKFYVHKTADKIYWKAATFLSRAAANGFNPVKSGLPVVPFSENDTHPWPQTIRMLFDQYRRRKQKSERQQWIVAVSPSFHDLDFSSFRKIYPPEDVYWADPFPVLHEGAMYLFVEEFGAKPNHKGKIACLELNKQWEVVSHAIILEREYHLSYPFVFRYEGSFFMIPESSQNQTIQLFRSRKFPYEWELEEILMDNVEATDSTILLYNNSWWLFTTMKDGQGTSTQDELFIFYSDRLIGGTWTPHPQNPVVSDVRAARPAGRIFKDGDQLIRPSQDGSFYYGYGLNLFKITVLTKQEYREELLQRFSPDWDPSLLKLHTYNTMAGISVIDIRRKIENRATSNEAGA